MGAPYMQPLRGTYGGRYDRTGALVSATDYTDAQVRAALSTHRYQVFRYKLRRIVTGAWTTVADVTDLVKSCTIHRDAQGEHFQSSADMEIADPSHAINYITDVIEVYWLLRMTAVDSNYVMWLQGSFHVPSPKTQMKFGALNIISTQDSIRDILDAKITDWLQIPTRDPVTSAILAPPPPNNAFSGDDPLGWARKLILDRYPLAGVDISPDTTLRIQDQPPPAGIQYRSKIYEVGTSIIDVVNSLLLFCNYEILWSNPTGSFISHPFVLPSNRPVEWTYSADGSSIIIRDSGETDQDLFYAPNQWLRVVTRPAAPLLRSRLTLDDPLNQLSTAYRGRTVTDYAPIDAPDQPTLDTVVQRLFEDGQRVLKKLKLEVPLMPHWGLEKVVVQWAAQHPWYYQGNGVYIVYGWDFPCVSDGKMTLRLEASPFSPVIPPAAYVGGVGVEGYSVVSDPRTPTPTLGLSIGMASYGQGSEAMVVTGVGAYAITASDAGVGTDAMTVTGTGAYAQAVPFSDSGAGSNAMIVTGTGVSYNVNMSQSGAGSESMVVVQH